MRKGKKGNNRHNRHIVTIHLSYANETAVKKKIRTIQLYELILNLKIVLKFEVLMVMKMSVLVFWVVTLWGLVGRYQRFRGMYCFLALKMKSVCSFKMSVQVHKALQMENQH
jgi:hypothetical protein